MSSVFIVAPNSVRKSDDHCEIELQFYPTGGVTKNAYNTVPHIDPRTIVILSNDYLWPHLVMKPPSGFLKTAKTDI